MLSFFKMYILTPHPQRYSNTAVGMHKSDFPTTIPCNSDVGDPQATILRNSVLERVSLSLLFLS